MPSDVLLVEDNALIALNTEDMLREIGVANVRIAGTVAAALEAIKEKVPDFALLDVYLCGATAVDIANRLIQHGAPFAFASGIGEASDLPAKLSEVRILRKPYSLNMLQTAFLDRFS